MHYLEFWCICSHSCPMNRDKGYLSSIFNTPIHTSSSIFVSPLYIYIYIYVYIYISPDLQKGTTSVNIHDLICEKNINSNCMYIRLFLYVLTIDFFTNQVANVLTQVIPFCKSGLSHTHTYIYLEFT